MMILLYIILYIIVGVFAFFLLLALLLKIIFDFPIRPKESGFEYVYVEKDGSVRELYPDEVEYLQEEFAPTDGARPYIKWRYSEKTPDDKIHGFISRRRVPRRISIKKV